MRLLHGQMSSIISPWLPCHCRRVPSPTGDSQHLRNFAALTACFTLFSADCGATVRHRQMQAVLSAGLQLHVHGSKKLLL